jgi:hypothetical protein
MKKEFRIKVFVKVDRFIILITGIFEIGFVVPESNEHIKTELAEPRRAFDIKHKSLLQIIPVGGSGIFLSVGIGVSKMDLRRYGVFRQV